MENALAELSPDDRALLELSLMRGVSDEEIAGLLHVDTQHVQVRRDEALDQLIGRLDDAARLGELLPRENGNASAETTELPPVADGTPPAETNGAATTSQPDARRRRIALGLALLAAVVLAVVVATSGGGGSEPELGQQQQTPPERKPAEPALGTPGGENPKPAPKKPEPAPKKPEPAPKKAKPAPAAPPAAPALAVPLEPLGAASGARGTAGMADGSLELRASGLPKGTYTVWLYDSVIDAKPIGRFSGTSGDLDVKLPKGSERYESIDVSREPADGNQNHSGESVLRAPLAKLKR